MSASLSSVRAILKEVPDVLKPVPIKRPPVSGGKGQFSIGKPIPPRGKVPPKQPIKVPGRPTQLPQVKPGKPVGGGPVYSTQGRSNVQNMAQRGLIRRASAQRRSVNLGKSRGRGAKARYLNE